MNEDNPSRHDSPLADTTLDRLVDGEVSGGEYRELLAALERRPDDWRRCALAFLEAQGWGREFRALRDESPASRFVAADGAVTVSPARGTWLRAALFASACAASFLLTFDIAVRLLPRSPSTPEMEALAGESRTAPQITDLPDPSDPSISPESAYAASSSVPMGSYRFVVDNESQSPQSVEMPVYAADDPRAGVLLDDYATMPRELIRALESSGHRVRRQRNWIPVPSNSGNALYVPMDELQVTPVSSRSFQ